LQRAAALAAKQVEANNAAQAVNLRSEKLERERLQTKLEER
jgi:hypothetical protein